MFKKILIFLFLLIFGLSAAVAGAAAEDAEKNMTSLERLEKAIAADKYVYNPAGTRDPFRSVLLERMNRKGKDPGSKVPFTPLQKFDVSALKVTAIFWGEMGNYAIIDAPDGKGYTIKLGTFLGRNDGVVSAILRDMIVVDEKYIDIDDTAKVRKVILKLKPEEQIE